jgi:flap endonuclease-1
VRALALIRKHGSLEAVLESLDPEKHKVPADFDYVAARRLFAEPNVLRGAEVPPLRFGAPDVEGLVQFLVREKSFDEKRVRAAVERIVAAKGKASQGRLESFFKAAPRPEGAAGAGAKRKEAPAEAKGKGGKGGGGKAKKTGKAGGVGGGKK